MSDDRCPCGGIILADTEDWKTPLCYSCYTDLHEGCSKLQAECERKDKVIEHITRERGAAVRKNAPLFPDAETYFKVDNIEETLRAKDKQIAEHEESAYTYKREWESAIEREQYKVELLSEKDKHIAIAEKEVERLKEVCEGRTNARNAAQNEVDRIRVELKQYYQEIQAKDAQLAKYKAALESLYNDVKAEHGLDEFQIVAGDGSSLGNAKAALATTGNEGESMSFALENQVQYLTDRVNQLQAELVQEMARSTRLYDSVMSLTAQLESRDESYRAETVAQLAAKDKVIAELKSKEVEITKQLQAAELTATARLRWQFEGEQKIKQLEENIQKSFGVRAIDIINFHDFQTLNAQLAKQNARTEHLESHIKTLLEKWDRIGGDKSFSYNFLREALEKK